VEAIAAADKAAAELVGRPLRVFTRAGLESVAAAAAATADVPDDFYE
jgi:hypothetical protein